MAQEQLTLVSLLGGMLVFMIWGRFRYDLIAFATLIVLVLIGVVPADTMFAGFEHPAVIIIAFVLIITQGLSNSGAVDMLGRVVLSGARSFTSHVAFMGFIGAVARPSVLPLLTGPVLDEYTREALSVSVAPRMGSADVLEALYPLLLERGRPDYLRSDNGTEFVAETLQTWLHRVGIKPIQIFPGSPWENGYNERFNGTLRREVLNAEWFTSIVQARVVITQWLRQNNHTRPHQALNMRPPVPETLHRSGP